MFESEWPAHKNYQNMWPAYSSYWVCRQVSVINGRELYNWKKFWLKNCYINVCNVISCKYAGKIYCNSRTSVQFCEDTSRKICFQFFVLLSKTFEKIWELSRKLISCVYIWFFCTEFPEYSLLLLLMIAIFLHWKPIIFLLNWNMIQMFGHFFPAIFD